MTGREARVSLEAQVLPRDLFDNSYTYAKIMRNFAPRTLVVGALVPALITLVPTLINAVAPGVGHGAGMVIPWALAALQVPLLFVCASLFKSRRRGAFQAAYWAMSMVQFLWMQFLCWYTTPFFSIVGVTLFCTWAFNDAWSVYDSVSVKLQYLLAFVVFDALLLVVDATGGNGLAHLYRRDPSSFKVLLSVQVVLAVITQLIIAFAGSEAYAHDLSVVEKGILERELAVMRTEREVLQQSSIYLAQGLAASKFSHDVASPVTVIVNNLGALADLLARPFYTGSKTTAALATVAPDVRQRLLDGAIAWQKDAKEIVDDITVASDRVMEMTHAVARSLKNREVPAARDVRELIEHAIGEMRASLKGHDVTTPDPVLDLENASVAIVAGHGSTIGNLLTNGALQRPDTAIEVHGRAVDAWFYHLAIRDHGVEPDAREVAIARVERALSFEASSGAPVGAPEAPRAYRGYGVALMMAKVLVVRYNGCLAVAPPASGRGVVFHLVLPRCPPEDVPDEHNRPEAVLDRVLAG